MFAHVIQHIAFEHLGNLELVLRKHGYAIDTFMAGIDELSLIKKTIRICWSFWAARSASTKRMPIRIWKPNCN